MHSAMEKLRNKASAAKEHVDKSKAQVQEKIEKATATSKEEKRMAEERRKAKEAEAKKELHQAKAEHVAERLQPHHPLHGHHDPGVGAHGRHHHHPQPVGSVDPVTGTTASTYPLGGHAPGHHSS